LRKSNFILIIAKSYLRMLIWRRRCRFTCTSVRLSRKLSSWRIVSGVAVHHLALARTLQPSDK